jgi:hypothetical protein
MRPNSRADCASRWDLEGVCRRLIAAALDPVRYCFGQFRTMLDLNSVPYVPKNDVAQNVAMIVLTSCSRVRSTVRVVMTKISGEDSDLRIKFAERAAFNRRPPPIDVNSSRGSPCCKLAQPKRLQRPLSPEGPICTPGNGPRIAPETRAGAHRCWVG